MSIAVSAVVRPSRCLALCALLMCGTLAGAAALVVRSASTPLHHALTVSCVLAAVFIGLFPLVRKKHVRIDLSGTGQIRLVDTSPDAIAGLPYGSVNDGEVVQLLRGSTFWSSLMVLRLRTHSGHTTALLILPDSVDQDAFHALSVGCRWIAAKQPSPTDQLADISLPAD